MACVRPRSQLVGIDLSSGDGLSDGAALDRAEAQYVALGINELDQRPSPGAYDVAHLQAFHRHLFGDVYPWPATSGR